MWRFLCCAVHCLVGEQTLSKACQCIHQVMKDSCGMFLHVIKQTKGPKTKIYNKCYLNLSIIVLLQYYLASEQKHGKVWEDRNLDWNKLIFGNILPNTNCSVFSGKSFWILTNWASTMHLSAKTWIIKIFCLVGDIWATKLRHWNYHHHDNVWFVAT